MNPRRCVFRTMPRRRIAPHRRVPARLAIQGRWHASCRSRMRDSGSDPISREPREGWWFAAPPHCGLHSPTRGYGRRLPPTLLYSPPPRDPPRLALGVGTPTLLPLMLTFVKDDGWLRLSPELFIVLRTPSPLARRRKCTADKIIDT